MLLDQALEEAYRKAIRRQTRWDAVIIAALTSQVAVLYVENEQLEFDIQTNGYTTHKDTKVISIGELLRYLDDTQTLNLLAAIGMEMMGQGYFANTTYHRDSLEPTWDVQNEDGLVVSHRYHLYVGSDAKAVLDDIEAQNEFSAKMDHDMDLAMHS